jgi:hypothetical protein
MPYALIPEGFTLKKVTKAQEDAVKEYRRHDDVKTFLGNETTPLLIGGTAIVALTPALFALFLKLLKDEADVELTPEQRGALTGALPALLGVTSDTSLIGALVGVGGTDLIPDWLIPKKKD